MSFSAERGGRERVRSWREAAEVMDLGMAAVLKVPEVRVGGGREGRRERGREGGRGGGRRSGRRGRGGLDMATLCLETVLRPSLVCGSAVRKRKILSSLSFCSPCSALLLL